MTFNGQFFHHSIKGLVVGRFKAGKTRLMSSAWRAAGEVDGQRVGILRPVLIIDCDGGTMSLPVELRQAPDTEYIGITTEADWDRALELARSGRFRLVLFDSWSNLFDKFAMFARDANPGAKNKNMDWNRDARDKVAEALEQWSDLAVRPETRGITLISTAAVQDYWTGEFPNKVYAGEKIKVAPSIEDRLVGRHNFVWHCTREDPHPIPNAAGQIDVAATNAAKRSGQLRSRFLVFTDPFAGTPYVKSQDGFAADIDAIAQDLDLGVIISRHHDAEGVKTTSQNVTAA